MHRPTPLSSSREADAAGRDWMLPLVLVTLVMLQVTWLAGVKLGGAHLDVPLLGVVSVGLLRPWRTGAVFGLATGLLRGYFAGADVGAWGLSLLVIGAVCGSFGRRFASDHPLAPSLCAAAATLFATALFYLMAPGDFQFLTLPGFALLLGGKIALNALAAPLVHWLVKRAVMGSESLMFGAPGRF